MGKGDRRTKRGKIFQSSNGKTRPKPKKKKKKKTSAATTTGKKED